MIDERDGWKLDISLSLLLGIIVRFVSRDTWTRGGPRGVQRCSGYRVPKYIAPISAIQISRDHPKI